MKIALPVWNERVAGVFDFAASLEVVSVLDGRIVDHRQVSLVGLDDRQRLEVMARIRPDMLVCGAISWPLLACVQGIGVRVVSEVQGPVDAVVAARLEGRRLEASEFATAVRGRRGRRAGGRHGRAGRCRVPMAPKVESRGVNREDRNMRVAVTSQGPTLDSPVDPRFGRAGGLWVLDSETETTVYHDNETNLNAAQGAGIQTAKRVVDLGAGAVITGHVGPKAFGVLQAAGVTVYLADGGTVAEALDAWRRGQLRTVAGPDMEGHWT